MISGILCPIQKPAMDQMADTKTCGPGKDQLGLNKKGK